MYDRKKEEGGRKNGLLVENDRRQGGIQFVTIQAGYK